MFAQVACTLKSTAAELAPLVVEADAEFVPEEDVRLAPEVAEPEEPDAEPVADPYREQKS